MAEFLSKHSLFLTSVALIVCSFQLMSSSIQNPEISQAGASAVSAVMSPIEDVHSTGVRGVKDRWNKYIWLTGVEEDNKLLKERVKSLEAENSKLIEYSRENFRLRDLLHYAEKSPRKAIATTVIGRDPSNWIRSITLDRGYEDGLEIGLPVVDGYAVVGIITGITAKSSKVLLLTDSISSVDGVVQRTRAPGVVESDGDGNLTMRYVVKEDEVAVGDRIITSGLDGVFPKGVLIGIVTKVDSTINGLFQEVKLDPSATLNQLENVLVLTKELVPGRMIVENTSKEEE